MNKWDKRFMEMAEEIASWSSCMRRHVGAVIVRDKMIMSTGYNGAPVGVKTCVDRGGCIRNKLNIPSGTRHEFCYSTHAEQNAIIQAAKEGVSLKGCKLYCTHQPCAVCAKMIINAGIKEVVFKEGYPDDFAVELCNEAGVELTSYSELEKD